MGNASGVFNLMRNTGGSLGIAAMTTMLARGGQLHQATLVQHINPYNPVLQQRFHEMTGALPGGAATVETQQAYGGIYGLVAKQAMVHRTSTTSACWRLFAGVLPAIFLFKRVRAERPRSDALPIGRRRGAERGRSRWQGQESRSWLRPFH
jgi:DHA2 family multidrug resistance protein